MPFTSPREGLLCACVNNETQGQVNNHNDNDLPRVFTAGALEGERTIVKGGTASGNK